MRAFAALPQPAQVFGSFAGASHATREATETDRVQAVGAAILALGNTKLPPWQHYLGWRLDARARLARLLRFRTLALDAERCGEHERADFFWAAAHRQLRIAAGKPGVWREIVAMAARSPGVSPLQDPARARELFIVEVFIQTHCALYNGFLAATDSPAADRRAFVHCRYVETLVDLTVLSRDDRRALLEPMMRTWIAAAAERHRWDEAAGACARMLERSPEEVSYQDQLASLEYSRTVARFGDDTSPAMSVRDAEAARAGLRELESLHAAHPRNVTVLRLLGELRHGRAVKLANGGNVSGALVDARKAIDYYPAIEGARETYAKLVEMMKSLQDRMVQIAAELAQRPGATLNADGLRMKHEAAVGFGPVEQYVASAEPRRIAEAVRLAQAREVWTAIGLAEPSEAWDERATALLAGLHAVMDRQPDGAAELAAAWRELAAADALLADLDSARVCAFLERRLFPHHDASPSEDEVVAPAEIPMLPVGSRVEKPRPEPLTYWLASGRDLRAKALAATAALLVISAAGISAREALVRQARADAYGQTVTAASRGDYRGVMAGAEAFLARAPLGGQDGREAQVKALFSEALVRWFAGLDGRPSADDLTHIARYRQLVPAAKS